MGSVRPGCPRSPSRFGACQREVGDANARLSQAQRAVRRCSAGRASRTHPRPLDPSRRARQRRSRGLRRESGRWRPAREEEFRSLARSRRASRSSATGSLGSRVWSGPRSPSSASTHPSVDSALNAVSPYARRPSSTSASPRAVRRRAQAAVMRHLGASDAIRHHPQHRARSHWQRVAAAPTARSSRLLVTPGRPVGRGDDHRRRRGVHPAGQRASAGRARRP